MLDRILHKRFYRKHRNRDFARSVVHVDRQLQPVSEPQLLNLQVGTYDLDLLQKRHKGLTDCKKYRKISARFRTIRRVPAAPPGDASIQRIQGVKQKMRVDLRLQCP
jgi:hypothetical protein